MSAVVNELKSVANFANENVIFVKTVIFRILILQNFHLKMDFWWKIKISIPPASDHHIYIYITNRSKRRDAIGGRRLPASKNGAIIANDITVKMKTFLFFRRGEI